MKLSLYAGLVGLLVACSNSETLTTTGYDAIDAEVQRLMINEDVKGLAIIDDGQLVHVAAFGHRNVRLDFTR